MFMYAKYSTHFSYMKPHIYLSHFFSQSSDSDLPVCSPHSVCNKIDTYGSPWVEKQCRCPSHTKPCSQSTHIKDGRTVVDRNRLYKVS